MGFLFGRRHRRGPGWGMRGGYRQGGFWGSPVNTGMGYYPRRRRGMGNSLLSGLALGALGYFAGKLLGGRGSGGFGGFGGFGGGGGGGISGSGGSDWGGGNDGPGFGSGGGGFDAGGGSDW